MDATTERSDIWTNAQLFIGGRLDGIVGNANLLAMLALLAVVVLGVGALRHWLGWRGLVAATVAVPVLAVATLQRNAVYRDPVGLWRDDLPVRGAAYKMARMAGPGESPYTQYDRDIAARAQVWLHEEASKYRDKPWVLFVSFVAPHYPLTAPPASCHTTSSSRSPSTIRPHGSIMAEIPVGVARAMGRPVSMAR